MRKHLTLALALSALVALLAAGIAAAEKPVVVHAGKLVFTLNGGFSPKKLSRTKQTPITLSVEGKIATTDGSHPPALKEFVAETDKNGELNVKGIATCSIGALLARDTKTAKAACPKSIMGEGSTEVEVEFPEQQPFSAKGPLVLFNGGKQGNTTTLYVHAYVAVPAPTAIVTTVKITKIHNGRYGTKSVATVPKIAGGSGSPTYFKLKVTKGLTAKCPDGHLNAKGKAVFADGTTAIGSIVRTCTPKG